MSEKKGKNKDEEKVEEEPEEVYFKQPPKDSTFEEKQLWIRKLPAFQGCYESPIDLNMINCIEITLPDLEWVNFDERPKKTKLSNTGLTVIYSAKWKGERPYIYGGPFMGKYVFSNVHIHWGENAMEGSEHSIDGGKFPAEIHATFFKSCYLTQESALKEQDGCAVLAYIMQLQDQDNAGFQVIVDSLADIAAAGTSKRIENICILRLFRKFVDDYYMYWGSVTTQWCLHFVLWLITRKPIGISSKQLAALRNIFDDTGHKIVRNFREVQPLRDRSIFFVNPCPSKYATLLPVTHDTYLQYQLTEIFHYDDINAIGKLLKDFLEDPQDSESDVSEDETRSEVETRSDDENTIRKKRVTVGKTLFRENFIGI